MKVTKTILFIIALLSGIQPLLAQNLSNRGKEFWVGYGHHQFMEPGQPNSQEMVLYLSAEQEALVTVSIYGTSWVRNYVVSANSVIVSDLIPKAGAIDARLISLPCSFVPPGFACGGEGVFANKGIHIQSNVPIVAYAHIYGSASSGATMLMPVETWGYSYVTLNSKQNYGANCFSWVYAIAQHDNTVIEVTPAKQTRSGNLSNVPYTVTLQKGQIYQMMAGPETGSAKPEMSGSIIKSIANPAGECWPIAVFAGSSRTRGDPVSCGSPTGGDNDNQQCFPLQAWGKRYLTAPTSNSVTAATPMFNTYKIVVRDPATQVRRNGTLLTAMDPAGFYEFNSNQAEYITADKPVMVAQFIHSGSACFGGSGVGDPEMMYISPVEQGIKRTGFYRNDEENITVNYLTLVIPTAGMASLLIDGSSAFNHSYVHPNLAGYSVVVKRWSAGKAQAKVQSDSAFTAITYGLGSVESYGYNAGTLINNLSAVGSIFNTSDTTGTTTSHPYTCTNTPVQLSVLIAYQPTRLVWQLSQLGAALSPNTDVTVNSPVTTGSVTINGIVYYKYTLPGNYNFSNIGNYTIPLLSTHPSIENCNNSESLNYSIQVNGKPSVDFTYTHTGCIADAVQFTGPSIAGNGSNVNQWLWTYPAAATSTVKNPSHVFAATGNQSVRLKVVTTEGCVADTIRTIPIFARPVTTITATPAAICEGGSINFTGATTFGGSAPVSSYYWNFGNGTASTAGPHAITYPAAGIYNVKFVAGVSAACISDTAVKLVQVSAKPNTTFTYPAGCLPANGVVQFTGTSVAGQTYLWNFGDPASGASNTSTLANPSHTYPTFGNYTITYNVTNATGCTKDTTVNATFNLSPSFNYPALSPICQSAAGTVSVATATVTNGVPGSGVYHGPSTSLAGLFSPSLAGAGTHTIWFVFSASSGCTDSVSQTITVYPKPAANFTIASSTCLPASGNVQFNYTGSLSAGQTYAWNFGDPSSGSANTSTLLNPTHNYTTGSYNINLVVTNAQGCVDDTTYAATFSLRPSLAYPALSPVCVSTPGTVSVATATVTNGVTGTGVYSGPGTSAAGIFTPSIAGAGTHLIKYIFTATGNCVDSITSTITVFPKPSASFSFPAGCLSATGAVQFTYNGSAANTYAWNFGDPASGGQNLSSLQNPTHSFSTAGNYPLSLTVSDANTCTDDTVINAVFNLKPALNYPTLPPVCSSVPGTISVSTATVTNGVSGTGIYSGPGTDAAGNFNPSIAGPGTHTIRYVFTATGNCKDSVTSTITVGAKPNASFTYAPTTPCLPTTGLVQFTYNGSAATAYAWNFGDPASGSNNSSTLQNPTHTYSNTGNYNISLVVTGANGCTDDTTLSRTFSVMPALSYPALPTACNGGTGTTSVASATVTNGVSGTGVYSGPGTDAAGNFNATVAGPGTHTILYTFTSTGNCVASISSTITVRPKPTAVFTAASNICDDVDLVITDNSTISAGNIVSWKWSFGDNTNATYTNNTPFTHNYAAAGTYIIKLVTVSNNGCVSDTAVQSVSVHAVPLANFSLPASVCMPDGSVAFQNTSTVSDNSALTYQWNFGDLNSSTAANPTHNYAVGGSYDIRLTATSQFGCVHDTVKTFANFFDKPLAAFSVSPDSLCQGSPVAFTNTSSAPNSTISTYLWILGDGTTTSVMNPVKTYSAAGTFDVKLVVTSAERCISDTIVHSVVVHEQPVIDAGPSFVVAEGTQIQFVGVSTSPAFTFLWTPASGLSDPTILNPTLLAISNNLYVLTATGNGNCTASDSLTVKVLKKVTIPNAFSPNGDGVNDIWQIDYLADYPGATVQIFNRYGQSVFSSNGYGNAWDGTIKGKPLPVATYYYIIDLKNGFKSLSGSITLIR